MRSKVKLWEPVFSSTTWVLEINEVITFGSQYWLSHLANSGPELLILLKAGIISMNHHTGFSGVLGKHYSKQSIFSAP